MSDGNVITMNFKVSSRLKKIIEDHAKNRNLSISEYVRCAVLIDMVFDSDVDALNYLTTDVLGDFIELVRDAVQKRNFK